MKDTFSPWVMLTCPICGKEFLPAGQHAYKIGKTRWKQQLVCSYTCQRKWEKNPKIKLVENAGCRCNHRKDVRIIETGETFSTIRDCAKHLGVSESSVYRAIYKDREVKGLHIEEVV